MFVSYFNSICYFPENKDIIDHRNATYKEIIEKLIYNILISSNILIYYAKHKLRCKYLWSNVIYYLPEDDIK